MDRKNRDASYRKAKRKQRIIREIWHDGTEYYDNLHQYSKNKIHCSCPMCSAKTKNKGKRRYKRGNYSPTHNYKHSDLLKVLDMEQQEAEFSNEE